MSELVDKVRQAILADNSDRFLRASQVDATGAIVAMFDWLGKEPYPVCAH